MSETTLPPAGWYPEGNGQRFWDGQQWTDNRAPLAPAAPITPPRSVGAAYAFLLLLGGFGAHKFYLGQPGLAIAQIALWWGGWLLTAVFIGFLGIAAVAIWWFVDLVTLPSQVEAVNRASR